MWALSVYMATMPQSARLPSLAHHAWDTGLAPQVAPLFLTLQWAQARSLATMAPVLQKHRLTLAEFDVLATLRNAPPPHQLTPSAIQQQVVITSGGLTKILNQLGKQGWIRRFQCDNDQRVKPVGLSEAGCQLIEAAMADALAATAAWLHQRLTPQEITEAIRLLTLLFTPLAAPEPSKEEDPGPPYPRD